MRNALYDRGIFKEKKCDAFVISIGSVVAGGTGKTPLTEFFAKEFQKRAKVAILSRGYRSLAEKTKTPTIVSKGSGPLFSPQECGDEPYLLAENVPGAIVIAGKKRFDSASIAINLGAKVIILDDGMQHRALKRDVEIVAEGSEKTDHFLPRGFLRDDPKRVLKADFVFSNETVTFKMTPSLPIENEKIAVFCAIARPKQFIAGLKELKAEVVDTLFLADHEEIEEKRLHHYATKARSFGAKYLVCTQKDHVKLNLKNKLPLAIVWVKKEIVHIKDSELFEKIMRHLK